MLETNRGEIPQAAGIFVLLLSKRSLLFYSVVGCECEAHIPSVLMDYNPKSVAIPNSAKCSKVTHKKKITSLKTSSDNWLWWFLSLPENGSGFCISLKHHLRLSSENSI